MGRKPKPSRRDAVLDDAESPPRRKAANQTRLQRGEASVLETYEQPPHRNGRDDIERGRSDDPERGNRSEE